MNILKQIIVFFKKIGILKVEGKAGTYKGTKDKPYQIDVDPMKEQ